MRTEFPPVKSRTIRSRRSISDKVRNALQQLAGGHAKLLAHQEKAWASITFAGTRHDIMLEFDNDDAIEAGEQLIAALPDHEFTIPGQLVAEASLASVDHTMLPKPRLVMKVALLLLEEA